MNSKSTDKLQTKRKRGNPNFVKGNKIGNRFKPGQSGNPKGGQKISLTRILKEMLANGEEGKQISEALIKKALQMALKGNFQFYNHIAERVDGKVPDKIEGTAGGAIAFVIQEAKKPTKKKNGKRK